MKEKTHKRAIKKYEYPCPLCLGHGKIFGNRQYPPEIRKKARKLFAKGMSLREIGKRIDVPSAQQVQSLIMARNL